MLILIANSDIPGSELTVRNELNALHYATPVTAIPLAEGSSDLETVAADWARQKGISIVTDGWPTTIVTTRISYDNRDLDHHRLWRAMNRLDPTQSFREKVRRMLSLKNTVWIDSEHKPGATRTYLED